MPNLSSTITVQPELRLCKVDAQLGYFHIWEQCSDIIEPSIRVGGHPGGVIAQVYAIVEFTDGIKRVNPWDIEFIDETHDILKNLNETLKEEKNASE